MLHITVEIIQNDDGLSVLGKRHFGNGESRLSEAVSKTELEVLKINPTTDIVTEIINDLTEQE